MKFYWYLRCIYSGWQLPYRVNNDNYYTQRRNEKKKKKTLYRFTTNKSIFVCHTRQKINGATTKINMKYEWEYCHTTESLCPKSKKGPKRTSNFQCVIVNCHDIYWPSMTTFHFECKQNPSFDSTRLWPLNRIVYFWCQFKNSFVSFIILFVFALLLTK